VPKAPTVKIPSPSEGGTVTVTARAEDKVGVTGAQFLLDGAPLGGEISSPKRTVARKWSLAALISVLALGAGFYWSSRPPSEARNLVTGEVERGPFAIKISETGELRAAESVTIAAPNLKGVPIIYLVPEGTFVKEGDELIRFDPSPFEQLLEESKAALDVSQAELKKAREDRDAQRAKLAAELSRFESEVLLARVDLANLKKKPLAEELEAAQMEVEKATLAFENADRSRQLLPELVAKGFVTRTALEDAELRYLAAKAGARAAHFALQRVSAGALPEDLERARIRLEQAQEGLDKTQTALKSQLQSFEATVDREKANVKRSKTLIEGAEKRLSNTELAAPKAGLVVYARASSKTGDKIQAGMIPFAGQPLIYLPDISTMVVDTEINEIDIAKVKVGGPAEVRIEAYGGTVFQGKVLRVGALAKLKDSRTGGPSGIKVFDVTVHIEAKDPRLKPGLTATVDIIVDRHADVVSIPLSAVMTGPGEPTVLVSNTGALEKRKVTLGASNDERVIVTEGLRAGEHVVLGPPPSPPS
jgi:HlyD family secretion protein